MVKPLDTTVANSTVLAFERAEGITILTVVGLWKIWVELNPFINFWPFVTIHYGISRIWTRRDYGEDYHQYPWGWIQAQYDPILLELENACEEDDYLSRDHDVSGDLGYWRTLWKWVWGMLIWRVVRRLFWQIWFSFCLLDLHQINTFKFIDKKSQNIISSAFSISRKICIALLQMVFSFFKKCCYWLIFSFFGKWEGIFLTKKENFNLEMFKTTRMMGNRESWLDKGRDFFLLEIIENKL